MAGLFHLSRPFWLLSGLLLALSGCATLSEDECVSADWYAIGYEDGLAGKPAQQIANHRKACAKHGVSADLIRYNSGRDAGLEHYCEPRNGYRLGRAGSAYGGVCPVHSERDFLHAYNSGRAIYDLQQRVNRLQRSVDAKRKQLQRLDETIVAKEAELIHVGVTPQRRAALLDDLRGLQSDLVQTQEELHDLRATLTRRRAELDARLERSDGGE